MNYYGDIPEDHKILLEELVILETWFFSQGGDIPPLSVAKGMTSMAYDYYSMEMDEEGQRLLNTAEKYFPGYFKNAILVHTRKDPEFARLVNQLVDTEALGHLKSLGFGSE